MARGYAIGLSMVSAKTHVLSTPDRYGGTVFKECDSEIVESPVQVVPTLSPTDRVWYPLLERLWNAFGIDRPEGFEKDGTYTWSMDD